MSHASALHAVLIPNNTLLVLSPTPTSDERDHRGGRIATTGSVGILGRYVFGKLRHRQTLFCWSA